MARLYSSGSDGAAPCSIRVPVSSISRMDAMASGAMSSTSRVSSPRTSRRGAPVASISNARCSPACTSRANSRGSSVISRQVPISETGRPVGVDQHLADGVELAHRAIRPDDAFAMTERTAPLHGGCHLALHALTIVRVNTCEEPLQRDLARSRRQPVNAVQLVRPGYDAGGQVPFPAAGVGDLLRRVELTLEADCNFGFHQTAHVPPSRHPPTSERGHRSTRNVIRLPGQPWDFVVGCAGRA